MDVWIGWDSREPRTYAVAEKTCRRQGGRPRKLELGKLRDAKLMWRDLERRGAQLWDKVSDAPCSTEFAISRFLVPILQHTGWCLFTDCDVVFLRPLVELEAHKDETKAVLVVRHELEHTDDTKMDGQIQTSYPRKNESSVMLINADHPAWRRVTLGVVNNWRGRELHRFAFLDDSEIGYLPARFNWLVNVEPMPPDVSIAHFTLGTPELPGCEDLAYAYLWREAERS